MYVGLIILGRLQYIQDTNVPKHSAFEAEMYIETLKDVNHQGLIIFEQNVFAREVEEYVLKCIHSLFLFGIMENCLNSGRNQFLYLFIRRVIKHCSLCRGISHVVNYINNFI
jgi:hypothetical protein